MKTKRNKEPKKFKGMSFQKIDLILKSMDRLQIRELIYYLDEREYFMLYEYLRNRYFKQIVWIFEDFEKYVLK